MKVTRLTGSKAAGIFRQKNSGEILGLGMIRSARSEVDVRVVYAGEREPEKLTSGIQYICAGKGVLVDEDDSLQIYTFSSQTVIARLSPEIWFEIDFSEEMDTPNVHHRIHMLIDSIEGKTNLFGESENMLQYVESVLSAPMERELENVQDILKPFHSHSVFSNVFLLISDLIERGEHQKALNVIADYFSASHGLVKANDNTAAYYGIKSDILQHLILHLETEKEFAEKKLFKYHAAYSSVIAGAILRAYRIRIEILKETIKRDPERQEELEELMDEYAQLLDARKDAEKIYFLQDEEKKEIRDLFKKAVKHCHPDIVSTKKKKIAQEVFNRLKNAFDRNDIRLVRQIYAQVRSGVLVSLDDDLQTRYVQQSVALTDIFKAYEEISSSELYGRIKDQQDFDEYFKNHLIKLESEIEVMKDELMNLKKETL